jgi:hypothetical protein
MKLIAFYFLSIINLACSSVKTPVVDANSFVKTITSRQWIAGVKGGGGGVMIDVYFKNDINQDLIPTKIHYQDREGVLTKVSNIHYQANIKTMENMDETLPTPTFKTNLKPTEAKVFYKFNNKEVSFIFANVKELELIAYPSAKPQND